MQVRSTSSGRLIMTLSTDPNTKGSVRSGVTGTGTGTSSAAGGQGGGTRPKSGNGVSGAGFRVEVDAPGVRKAGGDDPAGAASGAEGGAGDAGRGAAAADGATAATAATAAGAEAPATPATAPRPGHAANGDASPDSAAAASGAAHLTGAAPVAGVWYVKSPGGTVAADGFGAWGDKVQLLAAATHDGSTMCVVLWDAVSGRKVRWEARVRSCSMEWERGPNAVSGHKGREDACVLAVLLCRKGQGVRAVGSSQQEQGTHSSAAALQPMQFCTSSCLATYAILH